MRGERWILVAAGFALLLWATPARAQYTGGSMGGGSFSGGGGGGFSGGGGSYSYSGGGGYYSGGDSYGGAGCNGGAWAFVAVFTTWALFELLLTFGKKPPTQRPSERIDVTGLQLAIDWRARKFIQAELKKIGETSDTSTPAGLNAMLRRVAQALRRSRESWIYAGFADISPTTPPEAESYFNQLADDAKSRFRAELVRNQDGAVTHADAPANLRPRAEEGAGLVVITLLLAAHGEIADHDDATDAEQIRGWLETASAFSTDRLAAVQIIWSPAAENDRMSSAELEVLYPELARVHGSTLAGRVYCQYCGGPYPAELQACPHCGGKAAAA